MTRFYSANAQPTTLSAAVTDTATTIQVAATTGFPAVEFILALDYGTAQQELVRVTNVAGTTLTVTRGFDSSSAQAHSLGAAVRHVHTADDFRLSRTHEAASSGVHGVSGALVGTSDAQALSNKDLSSGTNVFPASLSTASNTQTLTNKTISVDNNTVSGVAASSFVLSDTSGNIDGAAAQKAVPSGAVVGTTDSQTLSGKTIDLGANTVTTTKAQLNAAVSDADVATLDGTETLTNKTLSTGTKVGAGTDISGAWTSYPVSWTSAGAAPSVGDGALIGAYVQIGKTVHFRVSLTIGSTSNGGTGEWRFSLPVAANAALAPSGTAIGPIGMGTAQDVSAAVRNPKWVSPISTTNVIVWDTSGSINGAAPWAWAVGDTLLFQGTYEAA